MPINQRFFEGGDTFRGFALAGIGPRDLDAPLNTGAIGGNVFAIGTLSGAAADPAAGKLWRLDRRLSPISAPWARSTMSSARLYSSMSCVKDNLAFRASAGLSLGWKSPFGPLQIDLGLPYRQDHYDRPQILHFSAGTGF